MSDNSPCRTTCHQTPPACLTARALAYQDGGGHPRDTLCPVVLSFTFLVPASAQEHTNGIFGQFAVGYRFGGWTEFQFKIVSA
jgi:hypothetical protein